MCGAFLAPHGRLLADGGAVEDICTFLHCLRKCGRVRGTELFGDVGVCKLKHLLVRVLAAGTIAKGATGGGHNGVELHFSRVKIANEPFDHAAVGSTIAEVVRVGLGAAGGMAFMFGHIGNMPICGMCRIYQAAKRCNERCYNCYEVFPHFCAPFLR